MAGWREQKNNARLLVHRTFEVPVRCRMSDNSVLATTARLHSKTKTTGDLESEGYAERQEIVPRVIFLKQDILPENNMIIVTEDGEAYYVDNVLPPDGITITCEVTPLVKTRFIANGLDSSLPYGGLTVG